MKKNAIHYRQYIIPFDPGLASINRTIRGSVALADAKNRNLARRIIEEVCRWDVPEADESDAAPTVGDFSEP